MKRSSLCHANDQSAATNWKLEELNCQSPNEEKNIRKCKRSSSTCRTGELYGVVPSNLCYLKFRKYPLSPPPISHIKTMQCKSYTNFSLFPTGGLIKNIICSRERERETLLFEIPKIPLHTHTQKKKVLNFFFTLRLINCLEYLFSAEKMHVYTLRNQCWSCG